MTAQDHDACDRETGELPPWELPGHCRRDYRPHRGPLLRRLANTAFVLAVASYPGLCLHALLAVWVGLLGSGLGLATWTLARHDLVQMRGGSRDPAGEGETYFALGRAAWGCFMGVGPVLVGADLLVWWISRLLVRLGF